MFRKLLLASAVAVTLAAPAGFISPAQAGHSFGRAHRHEYHYHVNYRVDHHHSWRRYGTYHSHHEAHHVAAHLRRDGYEARVVSD